jgi:hypothetical protein
MRRAKSDKDSATRRGSRPPSGPPEPPSRPGSGFHGLTAAPSLRRPGGRALAGLERAAFLP